MAVLGLVASAAMVGWLWRHPGVYETAPDLAWAYTDQPVDAVRYFAVTLPAATREGEEITVGALTAQVTENTAEARIEFFSCTLDPAHATGPVSSVGSLNAPCAEVRKLDPGSSFETGPGQQVVMSVQPTRPGRVELAGVRFDYAQGWQHGSAWFGNRVVVESVRGRR